MTCVPGLLSNCSVSDLPFIAAVLCMTTSTISTLNEVHSAQVNAVYRQEQTLLMCLMMEYELRLTSVHEILHLCSGDCLDTICWLRLNNRFNSDKDY